MRYVVQLDDGIAVGQLTALRQVQMSISKNYNNAQAGIIGFGLGKH